MPFTAPQVEMKEELVDPKLIKVPVFKYDSEKIQLLASSIKMNGLIQTPIIRQNMTVVVGKQRVLAAIVADICPIKVNIIDNNVDSSTCELLSLHENLMRDNLKWYDQVMLQKRYHEFKIDQYGKAKPGPSKDDSWSLRKTAEDLGISMGGLSENIRLADAIMINPHLRKIEDRATAKRVILTGIRRQAQELETSIPHSITVNEIHHGEASILLDLYPKSIFDAVITDPPWLEYKDKALVKDSDTNNVFESIYRVMKPNSFLYAFVSTQDFGVYITKLTEIGFNVQKWPLIWIKEGILSPGATSWHYNRNYEPILLAVKGTPALTGSVPSSIYSTRTVHASRMIHPHEKPKEIIKNLIDHCTYEGALILDPFAGSGVVAEACIETGRKYVLIEKDPLFFSNIQDRLSKLKEVV